MTRWIVRGNGWAVAAVLIGLMCSSASAQVKVLGVQFRADRAFPQYRQFWHEDSNDPEAPEGGEGEEVTAKEPLGASVHVLLHNTGAGPVQIQDVALARESLKSAITLSDQRKVRKFGSIYFSKLPPARMQKLVAAGEPIWFKIDPPTIGPGETGQVVVRLRSIPEVQSLDLSLRHAGGSTPVQVPILPDQPRLAGAGFSADLREVCLYWRHTDQGRAPARILLDGQDVTANATLAADPALNIAPVMLRMDRPLDRDSFHVFQGVYDDGLTASAGLRAWHDEIAYGMWGGPAGKEENEALARSYILDVTSHNINLQVANLASPAVQSFLRNPPGQQFAAAQGLRFVPDESEKWGVKNPYMFFIHDEPDCGDYRADGLAETKKVGALAQWCVLRGDELRAANPNVLNMLNLDMTYKPQNWYIYGQLPDVLSVDPYYQVRLATALWQRPNRVPLYTQATYISAVAEMTQSACEPNPLHVILYACSLIDKENKRVFPFPTPQSKRIEVYYALAGGAKGLSYWWYNPSLDLSKVTKKSSHGVGAAMMMGDAAAGALWKEIGLLGAEVRTAGPVLLRSCPADLDIEATDGLWVRSLLAGQDGLVLLVVNDRYANSEKGTRYQALAKAAVTVKLPSWMRSPTAFEVTARGTQNVALKAAGGRATVDLGRVNLTRMIVVTSDTELRGQLQRVYDAQFREKVARLEMKPTAPPRRR